MALLNKCHFVGVKFNSQAFWLNNRSINNIRFWHYSSYRKRIYTFINAMFN